MRPLRQLLAFAAAGALVSGALAQPAAARHSPAKAHSAPKGHVYTVTIANMAYGAIPPKLRVGDAVTFVNGDIFQHSVTARDKSFDLDLRPKKQGVIVLKRPGVFAFYCRYHPGMTGKLAVAP